MSGFAKSYRQKWRHQIFRNLREASVWAWMCDSAVWEGVTIRFNGELVELQRGQLAASIRFISEGFEMGERQIRTLLSVMQASGMIAKQTTHKATIITICNYDKYQSNCQSEDKQASRKRQAADTNNKEGKKQTSIPLQDWEAKNGELTLDMVPKFKAKYGNMASAYLDKFRNSCMASGRKYVDFRLAIQAWDWGEPPKQSQSSPKGML